MKKILAVMDIFSVGFFFNFQLKKFLAALTMRAQQLGKDVFTRQEMIQIHKATGVNGDPNELIEAMHVHSYLLLKGGNTYQLIAM